MFMFQGLSTGAVTSSNCFPFTTSCLNIPSVESVIGNKLSLNLRGRLKILTFTLLRRRKRCGRYNVLTESELKNDNSMKLISKSHFDM